MTDQKPSGQAAGGAAVREKAQERGDLLEWLLRRRELSRAQANRAPRDVASLNRAKACLALAERALDPAQPLREGFAGALAFGLYREATYWLLRAIHNGPFQERSLASAFAGSAPSVLLQAAGSQSNLDDLQRLLVDGSFIDADEAGAAEQDEAARAAKAFVAALLLAADGPTTDMRRALRQRGQRLALAALLLIAAIVGANLAWRRAMATPDLALGKPWRTSSTYSDCGPRGHACAGLPSEVMFHTNLEQSPWFELDLGARTAFSKVIVVNRSDCCGDRGYPIAIEVSDDASSWREVARRSSDYNRWTAKFASVQARYVRVKSLKKTYLHLEQVEVHSR